MAAWERLANDFEADVFCGLFLSSPNEGIEISPQTLLAVGQRHLKLDFDIYGAIGSAENDTSV